MEGREIDVLRAKLSATICSVLAQRISVLKQFGLSGLWLNADSNNEFNAGTVLGYSNDDWLSIKNYSGLWNPNGSIRKEDIWVKKLKIMVIHRQFGKLKTKWFCFGDNLLDQSLSRRDSVAGDQLRNCSPCDDISLSRIREFYSNMENRIVHYGTRFSRELKDMIRYVRQLENAVIDDLIIASADSDLDYSQSESNPKSKLENEFEGADEATQAKIVEQYFLRTQV